MAELLLQELDPVFLSEPTSDVGYDLLAGFGNRQRGINTIAVQVKATERPVRSRYPIRRSEYDRLAHSNVPGLLLVADVKRNRLYYAWFRGQALRARDTVEIPVTEINDTSKRDLRAEFTKAEGGVPAER